MKLKIRERVADLLDEWKWEKLFEESRQRGLFKKLSQEAEDALEKGEISELSELLD